MVISKQGLARVDAVAWHSDDAIHQVAELLVVRSGVGSCSQKHHWSQGPLVMAAMILEL